MFWKPLEEGKGTGYKINTAGLFNITTASYNELYVGPQASFVFGGVVEFNIAGQFKWTTGPEFKFIYGTTYSLEISLTGIFTCAKRSVAYGTVKRTTMVEKMHAKELKKAEDKITKATAEMKNINTKLSELEKERKKLVFVKEHLSAEKLEELKKATKMLVAKHQEISVNNKTTCDKMIEVTQKKKETGNSKKEVANDATILCDKITTSGTEVSKANAAVINAGSNYQSTSDEVIVI